MPKFYLKIKLYVHIFAEAGWVVIAIGFRITKCLQHGIATDQFLVHRFHLFFMSSSRRYELQDFFGCFCFSGSRFTLNV